MKIGHVKIDRALGSRLPGTRPEFLFFPENREGKEQVVFLGLGRRVPKLSLALEQPQGCVWVALEQEIFWGLSGPGLKRLLAPSLIDFRGKTGIRALYQAIGIPNRAHFRVHFREHWKISREQWKFPASTLVGTL